MRSSVFAPLAFALALATAVGACASSGMAAADAGAIPPRATSVVVTSDLPPDSLYAVAYRTLRRAGLRFADTDERMHSLSTERADVGASASTMRVDVLVEPAGTGSRLEAMADYWLVNDWAAAANRGDVPASRLAFQELVILLRPVPGTVSYDVNEDRARRAFGI